MKKRKKKDVTIVFQTSNRVLGLTLNDRTHPQSQLKPLPCLATLQTLYRVTLKHWHNPACPLIQLSSTTADPAGIISQARGVRIG